MITDEQLNDIKSRHSQAQPGNAHERWDDMTALLEEVDSLRFLARKGAYINQNIQRDLDFLLKREGADMEQYIHLRGCQGLLEDWWNRYLDYDAQGTI